MTTSTPPGLTRFDDRITEALGQTERIQAFRDIVGHYVEHHDVPEGDVAAALAVVAQGDTPLLLDPDEERRRPARCNLSESTRQCPVPVRRAAVERPSAGAAGRARRPLPMRASRRLDPTVYRIAVGKRHKVEPRQIVGAIANEGGLSRDDFGAIKIHPDFSLVDLPRTCRPTHSASSEPRISGKLIDLRPDVGASPRAVPCVSRARSRSDRAPARRSGRVDPRFPGAIHGAVGVGEKLNGIPKKFLLRRLLVDGHAVLDEALAQGGELLLDVRVRQVLR